MSSNPVGPVTPDDTVRRRAPRRSRVTVAAVTTAVLVAGGGTYWAVAAGQGGGADRTAASERNGDPPPLALDDHPVRAGSPGIAPGEPDPSGGRYRARGALPEGPKAAAVHRPDGPVGRDRVGRLAAALGVAGEPVREGDAWRVGTAEAGTGASLQVAAGGAGAWTFTRNATDPHCAAVTRCATEEQPRAPRVPGGSAEVEPIDESGAKAAAAPVLKALGHGGAKLDARQLMGTTRVVNAAPVVDGRPTFGWSTGLRIGPGGEVVGGNGQLAPLARGASYPVISAAKALALLNRTAGRPVGIGGCATAVPHREDTTASCPEGVKAPAAKPLPVTGAEFGLASQLSGGAPVLVPSWLFEVRPEGSDEPYTVTHPAVAPEHLVTGPAVPPAGPRTPAPGLSVPAPSKGAPVSRDTEVGWYEVAGTRRDRLVLHFTGGVCGTYEATARARGDEVVVRVTETVEDGRMCVALAKYYEMTVELDGPLGDRKVVDDRGAPLADRAPAGWPRQAEEAP
ncbi:hypothetical protein ACSMX9_05745 [Streptomyces sp. LE64]|uniref:hypothetical protein n=1 Tax=Streptomyces sp. LE64 TaxID=3448653 RepID=UPI0040434057